MSGQSMTGRRKTDMFQLTGGLFLTTGIIAAFCFVVGKMQFRDPIMRFDGWVTRKLKERRSSAYDN